MKNQKRVKIQSTSIQNHNLIFSFILDMKLELNNKKNQA